MTGETYAGDPGPDDEWEDWEDEGLAAERTSLAWRRTGLAMSACGIAMARGIGEAGIAPRVGPGLVVTAVGVALWIYATSMARRRMSGLAPGSPTLRYRDAAGFAVLTTVAGVVAFAIGAAID